MAGMVAYVKGNAGVPERFWGKAVAENEIEVARLEKDPEYVRAQFQPSTRAEALAWLKC